MSETKTAPPASLRLLHNGDVRQRNPHWHLKIWSDGLLYGEIIGPQSNFTCIQSIKAQLDAAEVSTLFAQASWMISSYPEGQLLPDDVMVKLTESNRWCAVSPVGQGNESAAAFFTTLQKILRPYLSEIPA